MFGQYCQARKLALPIGVAEAANTYRFSISSQDANVGALNAATAILGIKMRVCLDKMLQLTLVPKLRVI